MQTLVTRIIIWGACVVVTFVLGLIGYEQLYSKRHPDATIATSYLQGRLGDMTASQADVVRRAVSADPLSAMIVVASAQSQNQSPWEALNAMLSKHPSPELTVERLVLSEGIAGQIKKSDAVRFVDSTLALWSVLQETDPSDADKFLKEIEQCSPDEYLNIADDPSYTMIISRLDPSYRAEFRRYQQILTPLLAMASVNEWNRLLADFHGAQPRVAKLLADPKFGRIYGLVYMLNRELVLELENSGISETDAIEFVGVNGAAIRDFKQRQPHWTVSVGWLEKSMAPDGKSLFRAACADPAVFWLVAHDRSEDLHQSFQILQRYAGTDLPAILLKFGKDFQAFEAAMDALIRFDNEQDPDSNKRHAAAKFLSRYQDDEAFKDSLARHGAVLIPALSAGGTDSLAQIRANPNDIYKWVDEEGKPRGTPWWTYIPGGNIAYALNEKVNGRTLTWGELGWATVDLIILAPFAGEAALGANALLNGEKVAGEELGEGLVEAAGKSAAQETEEIVVEGATETVATTARVGAEIEGRSLLRAAGVIVADVAGQTIRWTVYIVKTYPLRVVAAVASGGAIYLSIHPEKINALVGGFAHASGRIAAGVPGHVIEGMWDELQSLAQKTPWLAPVYYALLATLVLMVFIVPIYLLKLLLYPVYAFVMSPLWTALNRARSARTFTKKSDAPQATAR